MHIPSINLQICLKIFPKIGNFFTPIIYAFAWLALLSLANNWLPKEIVTDDKFLGFFTIVFLFLLISKSTIWSIGHDKFGIKGDSRSRVINYHSGDNGDSWFDLFADNPELLKDKEIQQLIKYLVERKNQK